MHLRHRVSRDLDIFTEVDFDIEQLRDRLAAVGHLLVTQVAEGTLNGLLDGARVQFLHDLLDSAPWRRRRRCGACPSQASPT